MIRCPNVCIDRFNPIRCLLRKFSKSLVWNMMMLAATNSMIVSYFLCPRNSAAENLCHKLRIMLVQNYLIYKILLHYKTLSSLKSAFKFHFLRRWEVFELLAMIQRGISNSATELETAALVWALTKLPQYFDDEPFTVIMDQLRVKVNAPDKKYWETVSQIE